MKGISNHHSHEASKSTRHFIVIVLFIILIGLRHIAMGCQPSFKDHLKGILKIFHEIVGVLLAMDLASFISSVGAITSPN